MLPLLQSLKIYPQNTNQCHHLIKIVFNQYSVDTPWTFLLPILLFPKPWDAKHTHNMHIIGTTIQEVAVSALWKAVATNMLLCKPKKLQMAYQIAVVSASCYVKSAVEFDHCFPHFETSISYCFLLNKFVFTIHTYSGLLKNSKGSPHRSWSRVGLRPDCRNT